MKKVYFFSADRNINIKNRKKGKWVIEKVFQKEKIALDRIDFIFCSDNYLLQINQQYLRHYYFTDVISFSFSSRSEAVKGEIYLSIERIKENAKSYLVSYQTELLRVMIHGSLHLCNYKDDSVALRKIMRKKEDYYLKLYAGNSRET